MYLLSFLLGECGGPRRLHTVKWEVICQPKQVGGLDLLSLRPRNKVLLAKVGWRFLTKTSNLSAQILVEKYNQWEDFCGRPCPATASSTWRVIVKNLKILRTSIRWQLGTGKHIGFWKDRWLHNEPLEDFVMVPLSDLELAAPVCSYWLERMG